MYRKYNKLYFNPQGGMANANENCWPIMVIGGSCDEDQQTLGAFQEFPQVEACRLYSKFSSRPTSLSLIPQVIEKAVRVSMYGRPGATYVDIPGNFVNAETTDDKLVFSNKIPTKPQIFADPSLVQSAFDELATAKRPLVVIGKGVAYAGASELAKQFIERHNIPFLPTPMGKGVISDKHPNCVAAARSRALLQCDVILLLGARLNWQLHFGRPPRFSSSVKVVQVNFFDYNFFFPSFNLEATNILNVCSLNKTGGHLRRGAEQ